MGVAKRRVRDQQPLLLTDPLRESLRSEAPENVTSTFGNPHLSPLRKGGSRGVDLGQQRISDDLRLRHTRRKLRARLVQIGMAVDRDIRDVAEQLAGPVL